MVKSPRNRGPWKDIDADVTMGEKSYFDTKMWIFKCEIVYGGVNVRYHMLKLYPNLEFAKFSFLMKNDAK